MIGDVDEAYYRIERFVFGNSFRPSLCQAGGKTYLCWSELRVFFLMYRKSEPAEAMCRVACGPVLLWISYERGGEPMFGGR